MSRQTRLTLFTLAPSAFSSSVCIVVLLAILGVADWAFITRNPLLYHYLFGPQGLAGIVHPPQLELGTTWHHLSSRLSGKALPSYLFVLGIAAAVYTVLELSVNTVRGMERSTATLLQIQPSSRRQLLREAGERALVRFVVGLAWVVYTLTLFKAIVPWCVASSRFGIATISDWRHLGYVIVSLVALLAALHVQIVLLRLFVLRARVFGGTDVLLEAEQKPTIHRV
ncbi:MAG TPA: hypothetical protein VLF69_00185 [Candidatus Saccharimonadales bacterium]|nr:hypothetical protein [Candidatus Saccharimonadales bacterium]